MKRYDRSLRAAILLAGCITLFNPIEVAADKLQDKFLEDLSAGIQARSAFEEEGSEKATADYKKKQVNQEYDKIKRYEDEKFEDPAFDELVHSYIDAVELQMDALDDIENLPALYNVKWQAGYNIRMEIQDILVGSYGLVLEQEETETEVITEKETETETEQNVVQEVKVFDKGQIKVWITEVKEDDFYVKANVRIENGSEQNILVTTAENQILLNDKETISSPLYAEVAYGKKANTTMTFDKKLVFSNLNISKVNSLKFNIVVESAATQNVLYNGKTVEVKIDGDGMISLGEVNVDQEMIRQTQTLLNKAGFDCGTADGLMGNKTREAIAAFERAYGMDEDRAVSEELIEKLQSVAN